MATLLVQYLGDSRLAFGSTWGLYKDGSTPKRLKVTYFTTRLLYGLENMELYMIIRRGFGCTLSYKYNLKSQEYS